jgi:hypothetical protein
MTIRYVLGFGCSMIAALAACSSTSPDRGTMVGTIEQQAVACAHPVCAAGVKLDTDCDTCATTVCSKDPYCCTTQWDPTCVGEAMGLCGVDCNATDAGPSTCSHPVCAAGPALVPTCEACATTVCSKDPYCCTTQWDPTCVGEAMGLCGVDCNATDAGPSTCSHPVCAAGPALVPTCEACATTVCSKDPYCCTTQWDPTCVGEAMGLCKIDCSK